MQTLPAQTKFLGNRKSHIVQDFKEPSFIFVDTSNQQWCPNNQFKLLKKRLLYKRHERYHSRASMEPAQLTAAVVSIVNSSRIILQYVQNLAKRREDDCEEDVDTDVPESMGCGNWDIIAAVGLVDYSGMPILGLANKHRLVGPHSLADSTVKHHISQLTSALKTVQNSPPSLSLETNQNGKLIKGGLSLRSVSNVTIHIR
ncbi:unnamed protein product [Natator depressus]